MKTRVIVNLMANKGSAGRRFFEAYFTSVKYNAGVTDDLFTRASLEERWQKVK